MSKPLIADPNELVSMKLSDYQQLEAQCQRYREALEKIADNDTTDTRPSGWISVDERLPEKDEPCLYYFEVTGISKGMYLGDNCFGGKRGFLCGDVTHWMKLPPAPIVAILEARK